MNKLILWGVTAAMTIITSSTFAADADPYLWLEEVDGARALEWVKAQNAKTLAELQAAREYAPTYARSLAIYDSPQRIPSPSLRGNMIYNFWQDQAHERGLWRRATIASYRSAQPEWETLLDIDVLSKQEQQPWVFKGGAILPPDNRLCLVSLSKGGGDAAEVREFDTAAKAFVKDGFFLPAAKSRVAWRDADTLWVATDFGPGALTSSGYPRLIKLWQRGTPLTSARTVFEGATEDVSVNGWTVFTADGRYDLVTRSKTFFATEYYLLLGERLVRLPLPEDAELQEIFRDQILFSLRSDWTVAGQTYRSGTLLAIDLDDLIQLKRNFTTLFEPGARTSLDSVSSTRDRVLVTALDNVRGRLTRLAF
ncbi:MAG: S9 family peptidase, partial [Vicinamibacteria bacterium]|nr:S9 family peptidase [Vicinamibacteria bacterium]